MSEQSELKIRSAGRPGRAARRAGGEQAEAHAVPACRPTPAPDAAAGDVGWDDGPRVGTGRSVDRGGV